MRINFATLAFGYFINDTTDTPSWETPLGQGKGYKININPAIDEILRGMVYSIVPLEKISTKLGRGGGTVYGNSENSKIKLASLFSKVFVNDTLIDNGKFILLITQDQSESHAGRLFLKYSIHNTYKNGTEEYSNHKFFKEVTKQLSLADDSCWFVHDISIRNQDELVLNAVIVNPNASMKYPNKSSFRAAWESMVTISEPEPDTKDIVTENFPNNLSVTQLGTILCNMYNDASNKVAGIHMFGIKFAPIIKKHKYKYADIITASGIKKSYDKELNKGIQIYESINKNEFNVKFYDEVNSEFNCLERYMDVLQQLPKLTPRRHKRFPLNCILYGAPGTGKTYATAQHALAVVENRDLVEIKKEARSSIMERYNYLIQTKQIVFTTFHQNYGYEDFIQGIRPDTSTDELKFKTVDGIFKVIVQKAMTEPNKDFVIIIDEINRANISKVFGELITLIEEDKRWGEENAISVTLPTGDPFAIPNNLYIIGTMNSADKSISLIDTALRRRFDFIEFIPNATLISDENLKFVFEKLNKNLAIELNSSDLLIGHSYFINKTVDDLCDIMNCSIIPLLYEYFFDNQKKVLAQLENAVEGYDVNIINGTLGRIRLIKKEG